MSNTTFPEPAERAPSKLSIILAGEDVVATLLNGSQVAVRVRAMPVRHLGRVLHLADNEAALLEFVCYVPRADSTGEQLAGLAGWDRVPEEWADNLSSESHAALYETAKKLNFSRAATWAERQIAAKQLNGSITLKAKEALQPVMQEMLQPLLEQIESFAASLPKPSATPAAPSTTS